MPRWAPGLQAVIASSSIRRWQPVLAWASGSAPPRPERGASRRRPSRLLSTSRASSGSTSLSALSTCRRSFSVDHLTADLQLCPDWRTAVRLGVGAEQRTVIEPERSECSLYRSAEATVQLRYWAALAVVLAACAPAHVPARNTPASAGLASLRSGLAVYDGVVRIDPATREVNARCVRPVRRARVRFRRRRSFMD